MPHRVTVHIYDLGESKALQRVNKALRIIGTGAFHAAVEVLGQEYSYGMLEEEGTGVFNCDPKGCYLHTYRQSLEMGETELSEAQVYALLEDLRREWVGMEYDLLRANCCTFSSHFCERLGLGPLPPWVQNLAGAGATLGDGISVAVSAAQRAAIIAAAKAGEIDGKYLNSSVSTTFSKASSQIEGVKAAGRVSRGAEDDCYKFGDISRGIAASASSAAQGLSARGAESRGVEPGNGYKPGDLTRGLVSRMRGRSGS